MDPNLSYGEGMRPTAEQIYNRLSKFLEEERPAVVIFTEFDIAFLHSCNISAV